MNASKQIQKNNLQNKYNAKLDSQIKPIMLAELNINNFV